MPLHPTVYLSWLYFIVSHLENETPLVNFNELSLLAFPNDCLHFLRLDIFVLPPLADTCSILPFSVRQFVLVHNSWVIWKVRTPR